MTEPEIATTTLAEIYVQQGLIDRALAMYRRVAERLPRDPRVVARLAELERELERQGIGGGSPATNPPEVPFAEASPEPAVAAAVEVEPAETEPLPAAARPQAPPASEDPEFLAWLERR